MENKEFVRLPFDETMVTVFKSKKDKKPIDMPLTSWLSKEDTLVAMVDNVRAASDKKEYDERKAIMPAATISVQCSGGHSCSCIVGYTGYMTIDIDGKQNPSIEDIDQLREELTQITNIAYVGKSVGGKGLYCIIPIEDPYSHKEHFNALMYVFDKLGIKIDEACDNPNRLRFYSYDENGHLNKEAVIYNGMLNPKNSKKMTNTTRQSTAQPSRAEPAKKREYSKEQTRRKVEKTIAEIIERKIDITGGNAEWFKIGCAFVSEFGEEGREMFRQVSQFSPSYNEEVLNYRYDKCLEERYSFTIATFFFYAKQYLNQ